MLIQTGKSGGEDRDERDELDGNSGTKQEHADIMAIILPIYFELHLFDIKLKRRSNETLDRPKTFELLYW